jgi:hypothetical protein
MGITQNILRGGVEKDDDGKFFIAKGIVATFHCASLKNSP